MTKPITPDEVAVKKATIIRAEIIEAANELIAKNWNGRSSTFKLSDLTKLARQKLNMENSEFFEDGELDIEPVFEEAGWSVKFDKPAYNETYASYFEFRRKRK